MDLFDIKGKKAIVTGGTRGLGYGMAEGLLEAGCEVVIIGTSEKVYQVAESFCAQGFTCHGVKADFSSRQDTLRCFAECVEKLGGELDILVNEHGIQRRLGSGTQCQFEFHLRSLPGSGKVDAEKRLWKNHQCGIYERFFRRADNSCLCGSQRRCCPVDKGAQ